MIQNRLRFLHDDTVWKTRDEAINAVEDNLFYNVEGFTALYAEPIVLKYGDPQNPDIILAIGSVDTDETNKGKYYFIDITNIKESLNEHSENIKINKDNININAKDIENIRTTISDFYKQYVGEYKKLEDVDAWLLSELKIETSNREEADKELSDKISDLNTRAFLHIDETNTIHLTKTENEDGSYSLSADLKLLDETSNHLENQLHVEEDGLFYHVDLTCNKEDNSLTLSVNGKELPKVELPEGKYVVSGDYDIENEDLVFNYNDGTSFIVDMGNVINEWTVLPKGEQKGGVILYKDKDATGNVNRNQEPWQDILRAELNISEDSENFATIKDGALFVSNKAKNIMYKGKPLSQYLNTLTPYEPLSDIVKHAWYDRNTEQIIIEIQIKGKDVERIEIPVDELFKEFDTDNDGKSVKINITQDKTNSDTPYIISADVNLFKDGANLLKQNDDDGSLYVNVTAKDVTYSEGEKIESVQSALSSEIESRKAADKLLQSEFEENAFSCVKAIDAIKEDLSIEVGNRESLATNVKNIRQSVGLNEDGLFKGYPLEDELKFVRGKSIYEDLKVLDKNLNGNIGQFVSFKTATDNLIGDINSSISDLTQGLEGEKHRAENAKIEIDRNLQSVTKIARGNEKAIFDLQTTVKNNLNSSASGKSEDHRITTTVSIEDGKLSKVEVTANNIASVSDLKDEIKEVTKYVDLEIGKVNFEFGNTNSIDLTKSGTSVTAKVKKSSEKDNLITIYDDGVYAKAPDFDYDSGTNILTYNNTSYKLNQGNLIKRMNYDEDSGKLQIFYDNVNGIEDVVEFDASRMLKPIAVNNASNSGITLTLDPVQNTGGQVLTATVDISHNKKNILRKDIDGSLIVEKDEVLHTDVRTLLNDVKDLQINVGNENSGLIKAVSTIEVTVQEHSNTLTDHINEIGNLTERLERYSTKSEVDTIDKKVAVIESTLEGYKRPEDIENSFMGLLADLEVRIGKLETDFKTLKNAQISVGFGLQNNNNAISLKLRDDVNNLLNLTNEGLGLVDNPEIQCGNY